MDARLFQMVFLALLIGLGLWQKDFSIQYTQIVLCLCAALISQAAWLRFLQLPNRQAWQSYASPVVSALGISVLVRADNLWVHPLLAGLAMSSKFLLRLGPPSCRSHVFNPANFAAVLAWALIPGAWLSPGQWGFEAGAAVFIFVLGAVVTGRISRWDISLVFLGTWLVLLAARCAWLGYESSLSLSILSQQICNGTLLLFSFFMISDPMTTPQHRRVRMLYAMLVAVCAFTWQYVLFRPHGLILMLACASLAVPLLNWRWPKPRFAW